MRNHLTWLAALAPLAFAQRPPVSETPAGPFIYRNRVLNAASLRPAALPGGGIARGSVFAIFGARLGPAAPGVEATVFPLSPSLAGVSVVLSRGSVSFQAWPVLVSEGQINAVAPSAMPPGLYSLRVSVNERQSNPMPVMVVDHAPGIYTVSGTGMGPAVVSAASTPRLAKAPAAAATTDSAREIRAGQLASIWVTGLGPIQGADNQRSSVQALTNPRDIAIWVGGVRVATAPFGGRALPGIDQVIFQIPGNAPEGCFVPVQMRIEGVVSNAATVAIYRDGAARCQDSHTPVAEMLLGGGPAVSVMLYRGTRAPAPGSRDAAIVTDKAVARAVTEQSPTGQFDPYLAPPPPGACTAYSAHGDVLRGALSPGQRGQPIDIGEILIGNGRTERALTPVAGAPGYFLSTLGGGVAEPGTPAPPPLFFEGGEVATIKVSGGGASSPRAGAADSLPPPVRIERHNLAEFTLLERQRRATLNWDLTGDAQMALFGAAYDRPSDSSTVFFCMPPRGATEFTVPDYILALLPPSRSQTASTEGTLLLATFPDAGSKSADGQAVIGRQEVAVQPISAIR